MVTFSTVEVSKAFVKPIREEERMKTHGQTAAGRRVLPPFFLSHMDSTSSFCIGRCSNRSDEKSPTGIEALTGRSSDLSSARELCNRLMALERADIHRSAAAQLKAMWIDGRQTDKNLSDLSRRELIPSMQCVERKGCKTSLTMSSMHVVRMGSLAAFLLWQSDIYDEQ